MSEKPILKVSASELHGAQAAGSGGSIFVIETPDSFIHLHLDGPQMVKLIGAATELVSGLTFEQSDATVVQLRDGRPAIRFQVGPQARMAFAVTPTELLAIRAEIERVFRPPTPPPRSH